MAFFPLTGRFPFALFALRALLSPTLARLGLIPIMALALTHDKLRDKTQSLSFSLSWSVKTRENNLSIPFLSPVTSYEY